VGNLYGNAYKKLRDQKMKKPHKVTREDINGFMPRFVVASSYPKRLEGEVELFSEWEADPLLEYSDKSRVQYIVFYENDRVYSTYDINEAMEYYNNL
jgi:hypothetical protein